MPGLYSVVVPSSTPPTNGNDAAAVAEQPTSTSPPSHFFNDQTGTPVPGSLKRKRPPSLQIPNVLREIHTGIDPALRQFTPRENAVRFSGPGVGLISVKGKKKFMEDTHKIVSCSHDIKGFFGVYDGHGGRKAADFVAENLHGNILEMLENCEGNVAKEEAIKAGYLKTDHDFLKQGLGSGACCVTALIKGNEVVVSNLGDCRAVLSRDGVAEALTRDHRAAEEDERKRIENKGGYLEFHRGAWRVHGILAVSRSIGDAHLKDWVLAEPDTKTLCLTPKKEYLVLASDGLWEEVGNQEAIDIATRSCLIEKKVESIVDNRESDAGELVSTNSSPSTLHRVSRVKQKKNMGRSPSHRKKMGSLKEKEKGFNGETESPPSKVRRISSNQENRGGYRKRPVSSGLLTACDELVNLAVTRGSLDDITVIIIDLNHFKNIN